ncbi:MAG TPA: anti-sigma factor [Candidatus Kapabacteria bacterium]|nr:anti-sigma factor [Candidatus Kapabacteria bacterium]
MDINEYISSGILELYVAGALSPQEEQDVERLAVAHEEVRTEIAAIEEAFEMLARSEAREPGPQVRTVILERIASMGSADAGEEPQAIPAFPPAPASPDRSGESGGATIVGIPSRVRYMLAASIAVAIVSSGIAAYFGYRWNRAENDLAVLTLENAHMAQQEGGLKARLNQEQGYVAALKEPGAVVVEMKGLPIAPGTIATVVWNASSRQLRLDRGTLPAAPAGKQYQLWALADGRPIDAGLVVEGDAGLQPMKRIERAQAFAITLEPAGGSPSPTLDAMYVMGKVGTNV